LPLLDSLEEKFICRELNCFLRVKNDELDALEGNDLVDEAIGDIFALF